MARGFAVLLVVFQHTCHSRIGAWPGYYHINWLLELLRMPVLMMVSGILTANSIIRSPGKLPDRCLRFAWLIITWTAVLLLLPAVVSNTKSPSIGDFVSNIVSPSTTLWFIWALVPLSLGLSLIIRLGTHAKTLALFALAAASTMLNAGWLPITNILLLQTTNYAFFFGVGGVLGDFVMQAIAERPLTVPIASAAMLVSSHLPDKWCVQHTLPQLLIVPERLAVCFLVLITFNYAAKLSRTTKPLSWLGRNTLPVYVAHTAFISILEYHGLDLGRRSAYIVPLLDTALVVTATIALERVLLAMGAGWMYGPPTWFTWSRLSTRTPIRLTDGG